MNKISIVSFFLVLLLCGCSISNTGIKQTTCLLPKSDENEADMEINIFHKNDEIERLVLTVKQGLNSMDNNDRIEIMRKNFDDYNSIDGVTLRIDLSKDENTINLEFSFDIENVDYKALIEKETIEDTLMGKMTFFREEEINFEINRKSKVYIEGLRSINYTCN